MKQPSFQNVLRLIFRPWFWRISIVFTAAGIFAAGVNADEPVFRDPAGKPLTETEYKEIIRSWRKGINEGKTSGKHSSPAGTSGSETANPSPAKLPLPVNTNDTPVVIPRPDGTPPGDSPGVAPSTVSPPATTEIPAKSKPADVGASNIRLNLDPRPEEGWEELKTEDAPEDAASVFDIEKPESPPPSPPPGTVQKPDAYIERTIQVPGGGSMTVREFLYE